MDPKLSAMLQNLNSGDTAWDCGFLAGIRFAHPELYEEWRAHEQAEYERRQREDTQERLCRRYVCGPWLPDYMKLG